MKTKSGEVITTKSGNRMKYKNSLKKRIIIFLFETLKNIYLYFVVPAIFLLVIYFGVLHSNCITCARRAVWVIPVAILFLFYSSIFPIKQRWKRTEIRYGHKNFAEYLIKLIEEEEDVEIEKLERTNLEKKTRISYNNKKEIKEW